MAKKRTPQGLHSSGRPFGENGQSGRWPMTSYTRPFTGSPTIKVTGKPARKNSIKNLKGRAATKNYTADPNVRRKSN